MPGNTPVYGFPYPEPTDLVADYPALGQQLAEDIEDVLPTLGGLFPSTPTSIANSGGTASLSGNTITFSGVSSVSLNGCFTGNYKNYVLIWQTDSSAGDAFYFRMRASGTDNTSANYTFQYLEAYSSTVEGGRSTGQTTARFASVNVEFSWGHLMLFRPFVAANTQFRSSAAWADDSPIVMERGGAHRVASAFDGITLYPGSGTITGTVSVYGYKD